MVETTSQTYSRRWVLQRLGGAAAGVAFGAPLLGACSGSESNTSLQPTPVEEPVLLASEFNSFVPTIRIQTLESGIFPEGINPKEAMKFATAEFYAQTLKTAQTAEELAGAVVNSTGEEIADIIARQQGSTFTPEQRTGIKQTLLEIVTEDDDRMFLNDELIARKAQDIPPLPGMNAEMVVLKGVLLHAYGHIVEKHEPIDLTDKMWTIDQSTGEWTSILARSFADLEFKLTDTSQSDGHQIIIDGVDEALPELVRLKLSKKLGGKTVSFSPAYTESAEALDSINRAAGVTDEALFDYLQGKRSIQEYIDAIAAVSSNQHSPLNGALWSLLAVGLYFEGAAMITTRDAQGNPMTDQNGEPMRDPNALHVLLTSPSFGGLPL